MPSSPLVLFRTTRGVFSFSLRKSKYKAQTNIKDISGKVRLFQRKTANFTCSLSLSQCHIDLLSPLLKFNHGRPHLLFLGKKKSTMGMLEDSKTLWRVSKEASLLVPHFTGEKTDEKRSPLCCLIPAGQLTSPTGIKPKQLELRCSRVAEAGPGRGDTGPLRCRTSGDAARSLAKG